MSKFEMKLGGRTNGKTIENAFTFLKYLDELEANKMYGIVKCGKATTLLTKQEVILKSRIEKMIEELEEDDKYYIKANMLADSRAATRTIEKLQELLGD